MKVAFSGHQDRPGVRWPWVAQAIRGQLRLLGTPLTGFCCLAKGSDQLFASELLSSGGTLVAVIPRDDYATYFPNDSDKAQYQRLKKLANEIVELHLAAEAGESFLQASRFLVDNASILLAVWDEGPAKGHGGTADVVRYAQEMHRRILIINPVAEIIHWST